MKRRTYQVNEVARLAGVSTRTLRYYDKLGLLVPSTRSATGYRLYGEADLLRLQQIMTSRTLGLALEDIRKLLDDPRLDRKKLLLEQRKALVEQAQATAAMIRSIDAAIALLDRSTERETTTVDMKEIFTGINPYEQEARERWGGTEAYRQSERRASRYGPDEWREIGAEWDGLMNDAAAAFRINAKPDTSDVMDIAERYRQWISRWFFACVPSRHRAMAEMFEADARFARTVDKYAEGLAPFWSAAIRANAARLVTSESAAQAPNAE